jgi:AcrR family transcriptional regulator
MTLSTARTLASRKNARSSGTSRSSRNGLERDHILDTALGIVLVGGPQRMRLNELARRLHVVPSALHYHFPGGKDELVGALFDREESRLLQAMARAIAGGESARSRLLALATARLRNAARVAHLYGADRPRRKRVQRNGVRATEIQDFVMHRRRSFLKREREMISPILRDATSNHVSHSSIELLAAAFQGALFNVTRTFALTPSHRSDAILAELVDVLVLGIEGRSTPSRGTRQT